MIQIDLRPLREPLLEASGKRYGCQVCRKFFETLVGNGVQEPVAIRKVAIHRHGSDAHGAGDPTNGDGFGAPTIEQPPSCIRDALSSTTGKHVYSVHLMVYGVHMRFVNRSQ